MMAGPIYIQLTLDMVPQPVAAFVDKWGRDEKTIAAWCSKGLVPGAHIGPNGGWWISPLQMIMATFDPSKIEVKPKRGRGRPRKGEA